jgi:1-deoxy-D-xylulose-5-phosphate reductoisomerase
MRTGGSAPAIFNAANEIAVERFLAHELPYLDIPRVIAHTLNTVNAAPAADLDALLATDAVARKVARDFSTKDRLLS